MGRIYWCHCSYCIHILLIGIQIFTKIWIQQQPRAVFQITSILAFTNELYVFISPHILPELCICSPPRGEDVFPLPHFSQCSVHREYRPTLRQDHQPWRRCLAGSSYTLLSRWPCSVPLGRERRQSWPRRSSGRSGGTARQPLRSRWWCGRSRSLLRRCCTFSPGGGKNTSCNACGQIYYNFRRS